MPKPVPAICDRCGLRFYLKDLKEIFILNKPTGLMVCKSCWEPSHPQLDTRGVRTDDKQSVKNARSDSAELRASRRLWAWNPVGHETTNVATVSVGTVEVTTT